MTLTAITLDDLTRDELLELAKRAMPWVSQRSVLSAKYWSASKKIGEIGQRMQALSAAEHSAFQARMNATEERQRAELHIKWLDAQEAYEKASRAYDAARRRAERIWEAIKAADAEAGVA